MTVNDFGKRIFINNEPAWHSVGIQNKQDQSAIETFGLFQNGIPEFEKWPDFAYNGKDYVSTSDFRLVRKPTLDDNQDRFIGFCGKGYRIVQPTDIALAFDQNVKQPVETLGFLSKGEKMFITWQKKDSDFVVVKDDVVKCYFTVLAGFDAKVSISLSLMDFRVVCGNTFSMAENIVKNSKNSENGKSGRIWVGHHNSPNILRDLSAWMGHVEKTAEEQSILAQSLFKKMAQSPVDSEKTLANILFKVYPDPEPLPESYPDSLRSEKQEKIDKEAEFAERDRAEVARLFSGDGIGIDATAWGLFNAFTEAENYRDSKKDGTVSLLFGARAKTMNSAAMIINDWINKK